MISLAAAVALLLAPSGAPTVEVDVVDPTGAPVAGAVVFAEPRATASSDTLRSGSVPAAEGGATLTLDPGVWWLTARRDGRWCWPREVVVSAGFARAEREALVLWPLGTVGGELALPPGDPQPRQVTLRVRRNTDPDSWGRSLIGELVSCPVLPGSRWECEIPAGTVLDLELHVDSFTPTYFWARSVGEGQTLETGLAHLVRGASLSGWVVAHDGLQLKSAAKVKLRAPGGGSFLELRDDTRPEASTNAHGFFQIVDLAPGRYQLAATARGAGSATTDVEVSDGRETRLRGALVLLPPASLHLAVSPARHPDGDAWFVRLMSARGSPGQFAVWNEEVAEDGAWHRTELAAGEYRLEVTREDGGIWYSTDLELEPGNDDVELQIQMMRISGLVTLGAAPLEGAEVKITESNGRVRVPFRTTAEGRFAGFFPAVELEAALWEADITTDEPRRTWRLRSVEPENATGGSVSLLLEIPDASIRGQVVNEEGAPQRAFVRAMPQTGDEGHGTHETSSDESTGEFALTGVVPGEYRVVALAPAPGGLRRQLSSPAVQVRIRKDGSPSPLRLVVSEQPQVTGRITTAEGVPVPGARVLVFPVDYPGTGARPVTTDVEGRFVAEVVPDTRNVLIDVSSPGVGRRFLGCPVPGDEALNLELDPSGRLVFELGDLSGEGPPTALVFHDGGWVPLSELARWSQANGEPEEPGMVAVPLMHAGEYRVCGVSGAVESHQLRSGTLMESRCDAGTLWPGAELRLRVPAASR